VHYDSLGADIIESALCGIYGIVNSRQANAVGSTLDVTVKYMVHLPMNMLGIGSMLSSPVVSDGKGGKNVGIVSIRVH
jgi:hypothetical protein